MTSSDLLKRRLLSTLFEHLLKISTFSLVVVISVEISFVWFKWKPVFCLLSPFFFLILFMALRMFISNSHSVYLVDFSCLKPPSFCRVPYAAFIENVSLFDCFDEESIAFMTKIISTSGQGETTCLPPPLHHIPPRTLHKDSINEAQMVLFPVIDDLLAKTKISPSEIDIIIVNCSGFCPSPSLSSIVVNKYSMRADIKSFNISGMGCSASAICIDLASKLLKSHKNSNAVVLSTEILSTGWYAGKEKPKLVLNCLFRMGSAAILLTNKKRSKSTNPKYELVQTMRTQRISDDKAYLSAIREEDSEGITGVTLSRNLPQVAGDALRSHINILGAKILPFKEKTRYIFSLLLNKLLFQDTSREAYVPNFRSVVQHFCVPTSARAIIMEIGRGLRVGEREVEAAVATLHRFGNQSSSSMWYQLEYMEGKGRVKKGEMAWQLGMGSGPKCSSLVWRCVRSTTVAPEECMTGAWSGWIDRYPSLIY